MQGNMNVKTYYSHPLKMQRKAVFKFRLSGMYPVEHLLNG